jgi:mannosyltransferase
VEEHGVPVDMFDSGIMEPKMAESDIPRLISLLNGHKTVWLVYSHNANTDPIGLIPQTLASVMKLIYTRDFNGVQVQIYGAP